MNNIKLKELNVPIEQLLNQPTPIYDNGLNHKIYWLGIPEDTAFRCNSYLIVNHDEAIIVDPGSRPFFEFIKKRVEEIISIDQLNGLILCHQDPDVAGSMIDWMELLPDIKMISSDRTNVLLPHFGRDDYEFYSIGEDNGFEYQFKSGDKLRFVEAPFLHFPGAFVTYDEVSKFMFSGDIWAALDINWNLVVDDFEDHLMKLDLFHLDYMASNVASRGFALKIQDMKIKAILPQHGSIIPEEYVVSAIKYLEELRCGLDIVYPELSL